MDLTAIDALIDRAPAPVALLVTGVPGAGKSSVCRALATRFDRAAHIETDLITDLVLSGREYPAAAGQPRNDEGERQLLLRERNTCVLARSLHAGGVVPVIDDVITVVPRVQRYRARLAGLPFVFVVLAPHFDVVMERDRLRDKQWAWTFRHLDPELRRTFVGEGMWVDSSIQTLDETVDEVMRRWPDHVELR